MTNFINELQWCLEEFQHTPGDIAWIGSMDGSFRFDGDWSDFVEKFKHVEFDNGFGAPEIATDLVVVFRDGSWFGRGEYDGSEWWDYHVTPTLRPKTRSFDFVGGANCMWETLAEMAKKYGT